ncbi:MAG: hypothetical protein ABW022_08655 [Actinoplanes sp.]
MITVIHAITVVKAWKMDARSDLWRWACTCGRTTTSIWSESSQAEKAGLDHKKAKEGNPS